ncbi:hypothetical protein NDU88_008635 [Pleurodeles waltl]|uniref:Uncharacterized protein n=1 Tax=Pleurodeles waltl TaxID=8319 RepID=A0AAV7P5M0_PLEWA|nr:hypothetical protein NDU88_008635 [Pleurodeles waltl]
MAEPRPGSRYRLPINALPVSRAAASAGLSVNTARGTVPARWLQWTRRGHVRPRSITGDVTLDHTGSCGPALASTTAFLFLSVNAEVLPRCARATEIKLARGTS